jgi:hypothetical protein
MATRYDKGWVNFLGGIYLVASVIFISIAIAIDLSHTIPILSNI